jgi:hypothetical protein
VETAPGLVEMESPRFLLLVVGDMLVVVLTEDGRAVS